MFRLAGAVMRTSTGKVCEAEDNSRTASGCRCDGEMREVSPEWLRCRRQTEKEEGREDGKDACGLRGTPPVPRHSPPKMKSERYFGSDRLEPAASQPLHFSFWVKAETLSLARLQPKGKVTEISQSRTLTSSLRGSSTLPFGWADKMSARSVNVATCDEAVWLRETTLNAFRFEWHDDTTIRTYMTQEREHGVSVHSIVKCDRLARIDLANEQVLESPDVCVCDLRLERPSRTPLFELDHGHVYVCLRG